MEMGIKPTGFHDAAHRRAAKVFSSMHKATSKFFPEPFRLASKITIRDSPTNTGLPATAR
jgi:hypothetical protein